MFGMMRDWGMNGHMGWGMGLGMTVIAVLAAAALIKYIVWR